ncbi:MAG TPA: response regulator transcription factor [Gaiellales bacterium]|jgi:DNA-binding NarL/FixJ family response regulator|nr:response regulator transcription factor [Gaiellales bacterium]
MALLTSWSPRAAGDPIACLVADDHPVIMQAICDLLDTDGFQLVARARDGNSALAMIEAQRPAVALLDLRMPGLSGIEVARQATRSTPETAIILYTAHGQMTLVKEALAAGARGFVLKGAPLPDITRAIEMVAAGGVYIDPALVAGLQHNEPAPKPTLTRREHEVLELLADGVSYEDMAQRLTISPETVRTHMRKAIEKLGARTRPHALAIALRESLIS